MDWAQPSDIENVEFSPSSRAFASIEYIPNEIFAIFPNLKNLTLTGNHLAKLHPNDFSGATELTEFILSSNKIKIIRSNVFTPLKSMEKAVLRGGGKIEVNSTAVYPLYKLERLLLDENEISEIEDYSFYGLNQLSTLQLHVNQLTVIRRRTFAGLPSLKSLELGENKIEIIDDGALDLPALRFFGISTNNLRRLSDHVFQHLTAIYFLNLNENELEYIGRSLQVVPTLEHLFLDDNHIRDLDLNALAELPRLSVLSLVNTSFTFAKTVAKNGNLSVSRLAYLDLSRNNLSDATELIKLKRFPGLRSIGLSENMFKDLEIGANQTLFNVLPLLEMVQVRGMNVDCSDLGGSNSKHFQISMEYSAACELK